MHRPFVDHPHSPGRHPEPSDRRAGTPSPGAVPPSAATERAAVRACRTR